MATVDSTTQSFSSDAVMVSWTLGDADDGVPMSNPTLIRKTAQISGSFDSATVVLEGSNDGTTWFTLNDLGSTAISVTADGMATTVENPRFVRPSSSGGAGAAAVVVTVLAARP